MEEQMEEQLQSVSSFYVFKSRLQEYAQKAGFTTPIYHTIKEGPSHQPIFRSTVVVNEKSYHSLTGFMNRKVSEQSAAEVALLEIAKTGATDISVSHPVHETGLSKNLVQEYAQKMNYAIPSYICTKDESKKGKETLFSCTVDIGGIKYIGAAAKTKKEAEFKAAKTALLAIEMSAPQSVDTTDMESIYTVVPTKRKTPERPVLETEEKVKTNKRKKVRFHKRRRNKFQKEGEVVEVRMDDLSPGEVNNLNLNVVKDLKSNGDSMGEVNELKSNGDSMGEVNELKSNGVSMGEVNGLKSNADNMVEVDDLKSNEDNKGEVNNLKSNEESVIVSCSNMGKVNGLKSNGESVLVQCSNPGEVKDIKSKGESVLVPCSYGSEVKDLKSNGESVSEDLKSYEEGEVNDSKSNWESILVASSYADEVKDLSQTS